MTEREYIETLNLEKIKIVVGILNTVLTHDDYGITRIEMDPVQQTLWAMVERLQKRVGDYIEHEARNDSAE